jgi:hypothetical protein
MFRELVGSGVQRLPLCAATETQAGPPGTAAGSSRLATSDTSIKCRRSADRFEEKSVAAGRVWLIVADSKISVAGLSAQENTRERRFDGRSGNC